MLNNPLPIDSTSLDPMSLITTSSVITVLKACSPWIGRWWRGELEPDDFQFLGSEVGVVVGSGNLHALQLNPATHVSTHIQSAAANFINAAGRLLGKEISYLDADEISSKRDYGCLLLGGPVANPAYRQYCGYSMNSSRDGTTPIPMWNPNGLRWGFFLGINEWGLTPTCRRLDADSSLEPLTAFRMTKNGTLDTEAKPRYGILDDSGAITMLTVDADMKLVQDYVLVTRMQRMDAPGRYLTMIAGAHGFATEAFGRDWRVNIRFLREIAKKYGQQFQVLIPANIDYSKGTDGIILDLSRAQVASIRGTA